MTITAHDLIQHLDDLFVLAEDNLVTTAHARLAGFGPAELRTLVRLGVIRRLIRGWYAVPSGPAADPPWMGADSFAVQRAMHRLLTTALVRSFEGRAVASHHSALVLHDVALWRSDLSIAHLARTSDEHSRHRRRAVIHPACGVASIQVGGVSTVPVAIAVVQVGLLLSPTGRRHPLESLVAADNALHQGLVTPGQLTAALSLHEGTPGVRAVRELLQHADGRHESVGETRTMHNLRLLGYVCEPQKQVVIRGKAFRTDGKVQGHNVFVEFDGLAKYLAAAQDGSTDGLEMRRRLAAEKARQDEISRVTDAEFVRFVWDDLDHLDRMDQRMREAITRAERRRPA